MGGDGTGLATSAQRSEVSTEKLQSDYGLNRFNCSTFCQQSETFHQVNPSELDKEERTNKNTSNLYYLSASVPSEWLWLPGCCWSWWWCWWWWWGWWCWWGWWWGWWWWWWWLWWWGTSGLWIVGIVVAWLTLNCVVSFFTGLLLPIERVELAWKIKQVRIIIFSLRHFESICLPHGDVFPV